MAVSNIGEADGFETVQVYVRDERSRLPRPEKELVSFEKVFLERDQTRHLRIRIDKYAVGYYDTSLRAWIAEEGRFDVLIGASSADIRLVLSSWWLSHDNTTPANAVCTPDEKYRSRSRNPLPGSFKFRPVMRCHDWIAILFDTFLTIPFHDRVTREQWHFRCMCGRVRLPGKDTGTKRSWLFSFESCLLLAVLFLFFIFTFISFHPLYIYNELGLFVWIGQAKVVLEESCFRPLDAVCLRWDGFAMSLTKMIVP